MHLINDGLQVLIASMTAEELGKIHAVTLEEGLNEVTQPKNTKSKILGGGDSASKIEQLKTDLAQRREALLKVQDEKFYALLDAMLYERQTSKQRKIEVVHPIGSPVSQQDDGKVKEYKLASPKIKSLKQLDCEARNAAMDTIDVAFEKSKGLKAQITMLSKQFDQIGTEGGVRNKKIADQAKLLQKQARELRAQLVPFKKHPNENIQKCVRYATYQLDTAIDEITQLVEGAQRNRKLLDGLDLATNQHGELLAASTKAAAFIEEEGIKSTWRDVPETEAEEDLPQPSKVLDKGDQATDTGGEAATDAETISTDSTDDTNIGKSTPSLSAPNSLQSLSTRTSLTSLGSLDSP